MVGSGSVARIGIIGAGGRGILAFGKLIGARTDARVIALADPNPIRMNGACELLSVSPNCYTSVDEMLAREQFDGIIITTPDYVHEANALAAIERGVHVLVDKPLATTASGCARIIRAATERGVEVAVGFNLRHTPVLAKIKELVDAGEIGRLMLIENREFYDAGRTYMSRWNRKYELSGGLWVHKGSHDFDIFNWWNSGGNPVRVSALAGVNAFRPDRIPFEIEEGKPVGPNCTACAYADVCPDFADFLLVPGLFDSKTAEHDGYHRDLCIFTSDKDTHDNGIAIVEYDNGVRASHLECFVSNFTDRIYTVVGDKGIILASLENPSRIELRARWGGDDRLIHVPVPPEGGHGGADPLLVESFISSILKGTPMSSTGLDGLRSVAVGEAAEISWREHRMVELSELADLCGAAQ